MYFVGLTKRVMNYYCHRVFMYSYIRPSTLDGAIVAVSVNIRGDDADEMADTAVKSALSLPITNMKLPAGELFPRVSKFCMDEWQDMISFIHHNPQMVVTIHEYN